MKKTDPLTKKLDPFGHEDPRRMPSYLYFGALGVDYDTAMRGDASKQNFTVSPRYWYVDAKFRCEDCGKEFMWTAREQKVWFEVYRFYIDSEPKQCRGCRSRRRRIEALRKEYDAIVGAAREGSSNDQIRVVGIVDHIASLGGAIPDAMRESSRIFRKANFPNQPE